MTGPCAVSGELVVTADEIRAWITADTVHGPAAVFLAALADTLHTSITGHADVWAAPFVSADEQRRARR